MNKIELKKIWEREEERVFSGWDFSYINNRIKEEKLQWNYEEIVRNYLDDTTRLLDMGTGGGEFLLTLNHPYNLTAVTESYIPNYDLCDKKLGSLGIEVKYVENDNRIPFPDEMFDIIINRHESFELSEVYRILKSGGIFITQQVGIKNNIELSRFLLDDSCFELPFDNRLDSQIIRAKNIGFEVIKTLESYPALEFQDVGALVYFAKIIEWEFPDFSVEKCFDKLYKIYEEIEHLGYYKSTEHRYLLILKKDKG
jgi:SAM-dependent methyltransferase